MPAARGHQGHAATTCMMSCRVLSPTSAPSTSTWSIQPARCRDEPGTGLVTRSRPHQPAGVLGRAAVAPGCHQAHRERRVGVLDHRHRGGPGAVDGLPARPQASGISGRGRDDERSQPRRRARRNWLQASSSLSASALACASSCALNFSASCATSAGVKGAAFLASAESKTALSGTACGFAERWKVAQTIT